MTFRGSSREYFRIALREKPDDPSILSNYGNWLKDRGELREADAAYRAAIASDDAFASAHGNFALLLDDLGQNDAAEEEYRRAVELEGESPLYNANLAFFLWRRRAQNEVAEAILREAVERRRETFTLGRLAFFTEMALHDRDEARQLYEEALRLSPEDVWTNGRCADFLRRADDLDAARAHFERAVAGSHPDYQALLAYAELHVRGGSLDPAATLLRRALKLRPRSPDALAMLAATKALMGAPSSDLERMYRQVLAWQPGHELAALNLAQLLLQRGDAEEEARQLLLAAADLPELSSENRLELLFYGVAYGLAGFEDAPREIRSLLDVGVRVGAWDLSQDLAAAQRHESPHSDLLAEVTA